MCVKHFSGFTEALGSKGDLKEKLVFTEVKDRGKTLSVLELAVDSVNFVLCNYLDYFPCSLIKAQKRYFDF